MFSASLAATNGTTLAQRCESAAGLTVYPNNGRQVEFLGKLFFTILLGAASVTEIKCYWYW